MANKTDNARNTELKKPWDHSKPCSYCESQQLPSCKHYRGGKTRSDRGQRR